MILRFIIYIQGGRLLPYFWKFSCFKLSSLGLPSYENRSPVRRFLLHVFVVKYISCFFLIFVVRTNHASTFTTKISKSMVDDVKLSNSCNNKVANTREINKLLNQGCVLVYTLRRVNDNKRVGYPVS